MNKAFNRHFVFITLFSLYCLSIPRNNLFGLENNEEFAQQHELLQELMSEAQAQTKQVEFCVQQILQTINAQKINLTTEQKKQTIFELLQIQNFLKVLINKLYIQTTVEALPRAIIINHIVINYMLHTVTQDISKISLQQLTRNIEKQSFNEISSELLCKLANKNNENTNKLISATDHIGLTWYNYSYRNLKKYHAASIAKGIGVATATSLIAIYIIGLMEPITKEWYPSMTNSSWYTKLIGPMPKALGNGQYKEFEPDSDGSPHRNTIFQQMVFAQANLYGSGILTVSPLISLCLYDVLKSMYATPIKWAKEDGIKNLLDIDQRLQGTAKPNSNRDGNEKVYFKDLIDCEELEALALKIASYMKHPERYERAQIEEHRGILLYGKPQTGKTLFAKALRTLLQEELESDQSLKFIDAKYYYDFGWSIEEIFYKASQNSPCIVFLDELDMYGSHRDKNAYNTSQLLTCMQGIDTSKQIFVIGATNRPEQLDPALLVDGRFGKRIQIEYPKYLQRKAFLIQQLAKRCITLDPEFIDCIAQETDGCSYNNLRRIITEALILCAIETRTVTQEDFEKTLDSEIRKIQKAGNVSEEEMRTIAIYQAGKALARHLLQTNDVVVKITINNVFKEVKTAAAGITIKSTNEHPTDNEKLTAEKTEQRLKLGEVFTKTQASHSELLSDEAQKKECLSLLAGSASLQVLTGKSYTQINKHDRAEAMQMIYNLVAQGEKIDDKARAQALAVKDQYEKEILQLLSNHKQTLNAIVEALMTYKTIDRYQWKALVD